MQFPVPAFATFTVPTGAGVGTARIVIDGVHGAILVYNNSVTALGSLIFALSESTFTDPYGNQVKALLNAGMWSAITGAQTAHFGVDSSGNLYIVDTSNNTRVLINNGSGGNDPAIIFFNAFGAKILVVDPQLGGTFQYQDNNSAVQGVLIGAQVGKNTVDPVFGGTVGAGILIADPVFADTAQIVGANVNLLQATWNLPGTIRASGGTPTGAVGPGLQLDSPTVTGSPNTSHLSLFGESADGSVPPGLCIATTNPPVKATQALLEVQGAFSLIQVVTAPGTTAGYCTLFMNPNSELFSDRAIANSVYYGMGDHAAPSAPTLGVRLFSLSPGQLRQINAAGNTQSVQGGQADTGNITVTAASFTRVTKSWNIPANDALAQSVYVLEAEGFGTQGSTAQTLQFAFSFGGVTTGTGLTVPTANLAANTAFVWKAKGKAVCVVAGSSATWYLTIELHVSNTAAPGTLVFHGLRNNASGTPISIPSNVAIAAFLQCTWGATTGAPTITELFSHLEKVC